MGGYWQPASDQADDVRVLTRNADLVELKLLVPDGGPVRGQARKVYFLDTPELDLKHHGIVVRVRERAGRPDDVVVKLRPMHTRTVPGWLRRAPGFHVEVDAMPGRYVCSGALKRRLDKGSVARALAEGKPLTSLLSARQRRLLAAYAPRELGDLTTFGPVEARKRRVRVRDVTLAAERWVYPDGSALLELSTKCPVDEAAAVSARVSRALRKDGIEPAEIQHTKTELALAGAAAGTSAA
ncbi:hypothetical protein Ade02nite_58080 [Paractinoplanes deccanensis]|uniref:CYTH domain-containing protein n=2 Tax=Paractinoplanes deccanensis TaxID=113561 RepID=A0ABQ3YAX7_9ACTN|nr:hypothetical protein Ade02nite_58080 [Actinoplanes deccanensis]